MNAVEYISRLLMAKRVDDISHFIRLRSIARIPKQTDSEEESCCLELLREWRKSRQRSQLPPHAEDAWHPSARKCQSTDFSRQLAITVNSLYLLHTSVLSFTAGIFTTRLRHCCSGFSFPLGTALNRGILAFPPASSVRTLGFRYTTDYIH